MSREKPTFLGVHDKRAFVFSLQPAVAVYEVSHVFSLCQGRGFDGQGLWRRGQPPVRKQSLCYSPSHKEEEEVTGSDPTSVGFHPHLSGVLCVRC